MPLNIQQQDYNIMSQPYINKYMKLNILNFDMNVVDEISGNLVSCDVSVNADSDLRRSCSVSLIVVDATLEVMESGRIWIDKFIQPLVGYENIYTGEIRWYNQGIYLINAPSYSYDATNNTLSFSGLDLMSKLTGLRNGALSGVPTVVPQGSSVREAIIAAIKLAGFNKYVVDECTNVDGNVQSVPYDIQVDQGGYIFDIIKQLRDILPNYQVYFDVDGVFHYDQIPSGDNDPVLIDDNLWDNVLVAESVSTDFEKVKNYIEVYGKSHAITNYSSNTTVSGTQIRLTLSGYTETAGNMIGFTLPNNIVGNITIKVNSLTARNLVDSNGAFITSLDKDVYYVAVLRANNTYEFLGHQQAQAIVQDDNPNSPFYVNGTTGIIREVLYGGDYDNIMSDDLALQRAKLELYWKCRLNDGISLSCIPIPWVDVNILVSHAPKNSSKQKKYMVKSFNASYGDNTTMTINAISYYAYYSPAPKPEPILPEGYTQLNYIQSTGTQYIDTGYVITSENMRVVIKFAYTAAHSDATLFGSETTGITGSGEYSICSYGNPQFFVGGSKGLKSAYEPSLNEVCTLDITANNGTLTDIWNETRQNSQSYTQSLNHTYSVAVFGNNVSGAVTQKVSMKLYSFQIYDGNVLVRDYIPCKNPDSTIGLYDLIGGEFYTTPTAAGAVALPEGYTQVEYLQSSGTQYIDTGFKPNQNTAIMIDLDLDGSFSQYCAPFGARTGDKAQFWAFTNKEHTTWAARYATTEKSISKAITGRRSISLNKNTFSVDKASATFASASFQSQYNMWIFATNSSGTAQYLCKAKIYSAQIYDDGVLIRNFVPARNASGTLGLYDTVNGAFYTNAGSGTFTAGADINNNFLPGEEVTN